MYWIYLTTPSFDTEDFEKMEAYDGLLWINSSIIRKNHSSVVLKYEKKWKKYDVMELTKLDLIMIVFFSGLFWFWMGCGII